MIVLDAGARPRDEARLVAAGALALLDGDAGDHHLGEVGGVVGEAAARAGVNPRTLYEKLRRYGIDKRDYR